MTDPSSGGSQLNSLYAEAGSLYCGGVGQLWKSTDQGSSWTELGPGGLPVPHAIASIGIAPDGTLCCGTNKSGSSYPAAFYWTGSAWVQATGLPTNLSLKFSDFQRAYGKFYISTMFQGDIYESSDNGHSWTIYATNATIRDPTDSTAGGVWAMGLCSDGRLCCGAEIGAASPNLGGIFRDPRTGGHWVRIGPLDSDGYSANMKVFFSDGAHDDDGIVWAGRKHSSDGKYVCKSTGDSTWAGASTGLTINQIVLNLGKDATGAMWESQQPSSGDGHTYRSTDGGANWSVYETGLPAHEWAADRTIVFDASYVYMLGKVSDIYRAPAGG